jgi:phosphopantetheinyl transferase
VGRLAGPHCEERLTAPLWHDGPLHAAPLGEGRPIVWSLRLDSESAASALATVRHTDRDLADFAAAADAGQRLLRRRLTRALLSRAAGVAPGGILFGRTAGGAPTLLSPKGWHFSVAGRAPFCLIGLSAEPIGVDVEPLDDAPPLWDMLTASEGAAIRALPAADRPREWLRRWCAKEAHAKRLGFARRADPAAIATVDDAGGFVAMSGEGASRVFVREDRGRIEAAAVAA